MDGASNRLDILLDLEARHDDLLRRLEELDKRVEKVLAEWQPRKPQEPLLADQPLAMPVPSDHEMKRAG
jgi:hypothetical protein